jgi:hypothetical protein
MRLMAFIRPDFVFVGLATLFENPFVSVCVCVCVCVCVSERERERESLCVCVSA